MNILILDWRGPFSLSQTTPKGLQGVIGLYAVECNSQIIYIGKAEYQGIFKEARSHNYRRCFSKKGLEWDEAWTSSYVGTIPLGERSDLVDSAENLLIYRLRPLCNRQRLKKYRGVKDLQIANEGNRPTGLSGVVDGTGL